MTSKCIRILSTANTPPSTRWSTSSSDLIPSGHTTTTTTTTTIRTSKTTATVSSATRRSPGGRSPSHQSKRLHPTPAHHINFFLTCRYIYIYIFIVYRFFSYSLLFVFGKKTVFLNIWDTSKLLVAGRVFVGRISRIFSFITTW